MQEPGALLGDLVRLVMSGATEAPLAWLLVAVLMVLRPRTGRAAFARPTSEAR